MHFLGRRWTFFDAFFRLLKMAKSMVLFCWSFLSGPKLSPSGDAFPLVFFRKHDRPLAFPCSLPPEIWMEIAALCDTADVLFLSVTCYALCETLDGPKLWRTLRRPENLAGRLEVQRRFQLGLPMYFRCPSCGVFHRRGLGLRTIVCRQVRYLGSLAGAPCGHPWRRCDLHRQRISLLRPGDLEWRFAHMLVRSHWLSPQHGVHINDLWKSQKLYINSVLHLGTTRAAITSSGELIVLAQTKVLVDYHDLAGYDSRHADFRTCGHHGRTPTALLQDCLGAKMWMGEYNLSSPVGGLYRCRFCPSEYTVTVMDKYLSQHRVLEGWGRRQKRLHFLLLVSRYKSLGRCISLDEPEWRSLAAPASEAVREEGLRPCAQSETIRARYREARGLEPVYRDLRLLD